MSLYFSLNCRETWFLIGGNEGQSDCLWKATWVEDDTPDTAFFIGYLLRSSWRNAIITLTESSTSNDLKE